MAASPEPSLNAAAALLNGTLVCRVLELQASVDARDGQAAGVLCEVHQALRSDPARWRGAPVLWKVAGLELPDGWGTTLLDSLEATDSDAALIGSLSPCCPQSSLHTPLPDAILSRAPDIHALSAWLKAHADPAPLDIGAPLPWAGLLSVGAVEVLLASDDNLTPWPDLLSQAGLLHAICPAVAVAVDEPSPAQQALHHDSPHRESSIPGLLAAPARWTAAHPLAHVRRALASALPLDPIPSRPASRDSAESSSTAAVKAAVEAPTSVRLHVAHSWGGGLSKWVTEFSGAEAERYGTRGLVLRSIGVPGAFGQRLALYDSRNPHVPLQFWELRVPIHATASAHLQVRSILHDILREHGVDSVIVSSLIGHSLDVLRTGLPTVLVTHDHHPWCVALYAHFDDPDHDPSQTGSGPGGGCHHCDRARLQRCMARNPGHRYFQGVSAEDWDGLRAAFVRTLLATRPTLVAPSESVRTRWRSLMPALSSLRFEVVPHGLDLAPVDPAPSSSHHPSNNAPLRLLTIGRLTPEKGSALLQAALEALGTRVHLTALGCGDDAPVWLKRAQVQAIPHFNPQDLPTHLRNARPEVGLLLSTVPETFSYALSEMWHHGLPVVATRLGALADRVVDGQTGWLIEPTAEALIGQLRVLANDRESLRRSAEVVRTQPGHSLDDMVRDYRALLAPDPTRLRLPARHADAADESAVAAASRLRPAAGVNNGQTHGVIYVHPEASWRMACRDFAGYTLAKAQRSSRLPAWVRKLLRWGFGSR